jgi:hypothetical protein
MAIGLKVPVFIEEQYPKLHLANPDCVIQHRLQRWLQLARAACARK